MNELTATIDSPHRTATVELTSPDAVDRVGEPSAVIWRLYAAMFDVAVVVAPALLVAWASSPALGVTTGVVLLVLQLVLQGRRGWTVAQRQMSLQLVDQSSGDPVGTLRATLRLFVVAAGGLVLGVGALAVMVSPQIDRTGRRRGWHDQLTDATVIDLGVPRPRKARPTPGPGRDGTGLDDAGPVRDLDPTDPAWTGLARPAEADQTGPAGRPAMLMWRLYAAMFDLAVVTGPALVATTLVSGPSGVVLAVEIAFCVVVVQMMLQGEQGWSVGQRIMVLRLVDRSTGQPVGTGRATRRLLVVAAGGLVFGVGALLVLISPRFDRTGRLRGWHDNAAGADVIDLWVPPPMGAPTATVRRPRAADLPVRGEPSAVIWRVYAAALDVVAVVAPALLVGWVTNAFLAVVVGTAVLVLQMWWQGRHGCTLAQLMMFLRVVDDSTHAPVGMGRVAQRLFVVVAGGIVVPGLGALVIISSAHRDRTGRRRGWHDILVGTEVVDVWEARPEFEDTCSRQIMASRSQMVAELVLPDGSTRKVAGVVLVGRAPEAGPGETALALTDGSLAATHLRLTVGPLAVWAEGLGVDGAWVRLPGDTHEACPPGRHVQVPAGSVIEVGDVRLGLRKISG